MTDSLPQEPVLASPLAAPARVLIVNRVSFTGGVERTILTLLGHLAEHQVEPVLAAPPEGDLIDAARALGAAIAPCPFDRMRISADPRVLMRYPGAWRAGARAIERHCRERGIDLIHAHHPVGALYARTAVRRLKIPMVLHVHETLPARRLYALAMRAVLPDARLVVCVSEAAARLAEALGAPAGRTRIVPNGVDGRFFGRVRDERVREEVRARGPGPHIGLFGVLEPRKAQHHLLEAARLLAADYPTARFWLIGSTALDDKGAYARRLAELAAAPDLRGRVIMKPAQVEVGPWLEAMDVVVQCSTAYESFGMAIAEALAVGRPVVATRTGGMPEVVRHDETGLIVPPADPPALAEALRRLIERPDLRRAYGERGRKDAGERFTPEAFARRVAEAYRSALEHRPPARCQPAAGRRLKIVLTSDHELDWNRGAPSVVMALGRELERLGHEVTLLSHDRLRALPERLRAVLFPFWCAFRLWRRHADADVIDGHSRTTWLYYWLRQKRARSLLVTHSHGLPHVIHDRLMADVRAGRARVSWLYPLYNGSILLWQDAQSLRSADLALLMNPSDLEHAVERLGVPRARARLIRNGLSDAYHETASLWRQPPQARRARIVQISAYIPRKGIRTTRDAMSRLMRERPDVRLSFLATAHPPALTFADYPAEVRDRIAVTPFFNHADMPLLLAGQDILIQPSTSEGFALGPLGGMAMGLVPVVSDIPGLTAYVSHLENGLVVPVDDPDALHDALARLIDDDELYARLRTGALQTAASLRWSEIARERIELYRAAALRRGRPIASLEAPAQRPVSPSAESLSLR